MHTIIPGDAAIRGITSAPEAVDANLLFVPVFGPADRLEEYPALDAAAGGEWSRAVGSGEFSKKPYATVVARLTGPWKATHVCFVNAGERREADLVRWRRVAAACGYVARQRRVERCAWLLRAGCDVSATAAAAADGFATSAFDSGAYKTDVASALPFPSAIEIVAAPGADGAALTAAVARGRIIGQAVNIARTSANEPANILTPQTFASITVDIVTQAGVQVDVLDRDRIRDLGMGLVLAVSQGSVEPPRLVVMRHDPPAAPAAPLVALIGKGVTFDTGGVSIKPADSMDRMKADMAGGGAVAAAMWALSRLHVPVRAIGLIPMVENMVGGRAFRPGDVFTAASGKTVEILNTDAEGRLILADALWYAQELGATHLVDIATLTGHIVVGLGRTVAGVMGRPEAWVTAIQAAADRAGDRVWPLPIYEEALEQLRSEIADLTNVGGRAGGAITAAAFLGEFAGDLPWAHIDIAGPAWAETRTAYQPKGATGAGVRTLIEAVAAVGASGRARAV